MNPRSAPAADGSRTGPPNRARRGRAVVVVAALFAALAALGGGAGVALGAVASVATEHRHDGAVPHPEGVQGEGGAPLGTVDRD
ncbi:hypothetical protein [Pseudonocardia sp. 73-21]|uniref:hypothetical protein n=1 Tax=Pseudonocardia sp. 73-21 TaxID=1895809 RepID=UPI000969321F|nr:hypothetical protein [Pseudonocardia sp. 73-21]OJY40279.1 MAG: hypothetical protein BGP03_00215 [Pseudonocardia sp. 73-21]